MVDRGNGVVTVTFSQLQLSDLGKYWCGVDRPGFDTFNEVHLTVKKGAVLFATVGGFSMITILVLLVCHRKCRGNFKSQPQVHFSGSDLDNTDEREQAGCDYGNIGEEVQPERLSERFSNTHRLKQDLPTCASAAAECSVPFHIYENICCSRGAEDYRQSAANVQDDRDNTSGIYVNPLPFTVSQTSGNDCLRKHTNEPTETRKNNHISKASAHHSRDRSDSKKVRPRSLWFGLDISGV
ncbi:hypothetical protein L3Q82_019503 [Scortum barcoo]|uniref:Uncharacterized protein n=1 Tax=Scortum barcoo TaxID=214431 RepID=A0ACB8VBB8_9TELE|nr:hypothetical protein L3Q82_019503 [Scortum barcoo]